MDKFLVGELQRWDKQQIENELADNYVCVYRDKDNKVIQQSRGLTCTKEKVTLVCTYKNGQVIHIRNFKQIKLKCTFV